MPEIRHPEFVIPVTKESMLQDRVIGEDQAILALPEKAKLLALALCKEGHLTVPDAIAVVCIDNSRSFGGIIGTARRHLAVKGLSCPIGVRTHALGYREYFWEDVRAIEPLRTKKVGRKSKKKSKARRKVKENQKSITTFN